ncbi:putative 20S rRNA accumulation protein 4 [Heracleum sosnowskyi]|uniref:20S rRNA accumulation protein 4 n=1 Tax=Heracleum sosnowskyi TaxID=360622 RepID=A0AAD8HR22_9APIA|nr:putative 20S rRNA accumulation protein 4 [Heracleum sosnowskyi]
MGEVILGMPGPWAEDFYEASDHYTTKFGGLPDWPIPNMVIPHNLRVCTSCGTSLLLVAQIYAPISTKTLTVEERQIFIFGCASAACEGNPESWIAIRVQRCSSSRTSESRGEENVLLPDASCQASNADWRDDFWSFDEGNDDDEDLEELGRALSEAASVASHSKRESLAHQDEAMIDSSSTSQTIKITSRDAADGNVAAGINYGDPLVQVLPCFYVYILEEALQKDAASICLSSLSIKDNQEYLDDSASQETWDEEAYEYDKALSASRTYLKFKKRIDAHPEQCFRYTYGGKPLLAAEEVGDPGRCELCGGSRHYEMQLMPALLYFLQQATRKQNYTLENWNWLTLLIYTCSDSCSNSGKETSSNGEWIIAKEAVMLQGE